MRLRPRTLTSRLALLLATLVLCAGTIAGVAGTIGIRALLMGQLDTELAQAAAHNVSLMTHPETTTTTPTIADPSTRGSRRARSLARSRTERSPTWWWRPTLTVIICLRLPTGPPCAGWRQRGAQGPRASRHSATTAC
ncbi:hypothetical protein [Leekyejoonella antrihumi]|uniref:Uncharacterized protein n=1 Tax=Leekyejoonella antrihumi TaxID=1660198 RepID=A0A563DVT1_9MICO|nr:hypothetical protein [Leekyejoonella antrihumi]TWP33834.1 hypothetical protein FGL98_19840 [Leekyejoonella antrihumi]